MRDDAAIEATYTTTEGSVDRVDPPEPVEPQPCPGPAPLTRSDVLRCARTLAAQVSGLAGLVEQLALTPGRVRPAFLKGWRSWCGTYLADAARLERLDVFKLQEEAARLAGYAGRLAEWRGGIAAEVGAAGQAPIPTETPAAPKPATWAAPPKWPWFIWMPVGFGAVVGAYMSVRWVFRQCLENLVTAGDREQAGEPKK
jgi:hypothetical protein